MILDIGPKNIEKILNEFKSKGCLNVIEFIEDCDNRLFYTLVKEYENTVSKPKFEDFMQVLHEYLNQEKNIEFTDFQEYCLNRR